MKLNFGICQVHKEHWLNGEEKMKFEGELNNCE